MKRRLHFCCGDVYLKEYTNVDISGELASQVKDNPNITTLEKYYKYPFGATPREVIADRIMDLTNEQSWERYKNNSIDEIIILCAIEHFVKKEAEKIIGQFYRILKSGGRLIIDFPDIEGILKKYKDNPKFMIRLIYGSQKNKYAFHKWGYTKETFIELLGNQWEIIEWKIIVPKDHPVIGAVAIK